MLTYRAVFHKSLCARMVHTTSCVLRQRGPQYDYGMEKLAKTLKLPGEQLENLNYDDVEDMYDQSANSIDSALHAIPEDVAKEKRFIKGKRIEQKYFKDLYKIKPGEVYNRNKDPFFKKGRDCKDFHHRHHNSIRKDAILAENTPKSVAIDDILTQSKYQHNPLNLLCLVESSDSLEVTKTSSKYTSVQSFLSSPDEAYCSPSDNNDSDQLNTGRTVLLTKRRPVSYQTFKVSKLIAAAAEESAMRPAEEEQFYNSFSDYNGPCLMLWSMKEQMRYLHGSDPIYWSPELLSTVFPISPGSAKKLLKSRWIPENEQETARHDSRVLDHWKRLSGGKLRSHALVTKAIQNR